MGMQGLVVATGPITEQCRALLSNLGEVVELSSDDEETLLRLAPDTVAFVVRGTSRLGSAVIDASSNLSVIGRSGIGVDGVDVAAATRRRIPVVITPHAGVNAVAEGAFALLMTLSKKLVALDAAVRNGEWDIRDSCQIGDLDGATLGIVGMGRIGRRVAEIGLVFNMAVTVADPLIGDLTAEELGVEVVELPQLFDSSDFISLHAPLLPETRGLISRELLESCGPGAILVNLARGALIESNDSLLDALESGALAGLGLDVFDQEPPDREHPLFQHDQVLFSPHALGLTVRARRRIFEEMATGMLAVVDGERIENLANPEVYIKEEL